MSMSSLSSLSDDDYPARQRQNPEKFHAFEEYNELEFFARFRLEKATVLHITNLIKDKIMPTTHRNKALDPLDQILITLRFFATGCYQRVIGDLFRVQQPTVHKIVHRVAAEIANLKPLFIQMPNNDERLQVARQFYAIAGFPRVVGAVDCSHIKIISPGGENAESFRNRKGYFSLNTQVVCDAHLMIRHIIARWPGAVHDSTIFNDSPLCAQFERGDFGVYFLLGDSGYPCRQYLLTPVNNPASPAEERYNQAQISTRNPIERLFGVLKRRFPCLHNGLGVAVERVPAIIVACAVLHNIATLMNEMTPLDGDGDMDDPTIDATYINTDIISNNFVVRESIINTYFN